MSLRSFQAFALRALPPSLAAQLTARHPSPRHVFERLAIASHPNTSRADVACSHPTFLANMWKIWSGTPICYTTQRHPP